MYKQAYGMGIGVCKGFKIEKVKVRKRKRDRAKSVKHKTQIERKIRSKLTWVKFETLRLINAIFTYFSLNIGQID